MSTIVTISAAQYFENFCGKTLNIGDGGDTMESGTGWLNYNYNPNLDCTVTLSTTANRKILLTWNSFNVESLNDTFGSCVDRLRIYDGVNKNLGSMLNVNKQCGFFKDYPETVSTGNTLTLHLTTNATGPNNEFYFVYTSFKKGNYPQFIKLLRLLIKTTNDSWWKN